MKKALFTQALLILVLWQLACLNTARGEISEPTLKAAATRLATEIKKDHEGASVVVGTFEIEEGVPDRDVRLAVVTALEDQDFKIAVSSKGDDKLVVKGFLERFPLVGPLKGYTVKVSLTQARNQVKNLEFNVESGEAAYPKTEETGESKAAPVAGAKEPDPEEPLPPTVETDWVSPAPENPYKVQVQVRNARGEYVPLPVKTEDENIFFVELKKGDEFAVLIGNASDYDAAISLRLDGIDRYALAPYAETKQYFDLVPRRGLRMLKGWYDNDDSITTFKIVDKKDSVAAQLNSDGSGIGTITVTFRAAWKQDDPLPPNEAGSGKVSHGVGKGRQEQEKVTEEKGMVAGKIRALVKIRYTVTE